MFGGDIIHVVQILCNFIKIGKRCIQRCFGCIHFCLCGGDLFRLVKIPGRLIKLIRRRETPILRSQIFLRRKRGLDRLIIFGLRGGEGSVGRVYLSGSHGALGGQQAWVQAKKRIVGFDRLAFIHKHLTDLASHLRCDIYDGSFDRA